MGYSVAINEIELMFIELFRVAVSAPTHEGRLAAIRCVKHEVVASRLQELSKHPGPDWVRNKENRDLVDWVAATAGEREEAIYELSRVSRAFEHKNERALNVAEQIGKIIYLSIRDGKREGVQTCHGILHQLTVQGKGLGIPGARDKDTVRKAWRDYRSIVHLGMALDYCEDLSISLNGVLLVAEHFRKTLSEECPRGTKKPYVQACEQISFRYESNINGPRFLNRGLPFSVED